MLNISVVFLFLNFQDVISLGNLIITIAWMGIAYVLFKLQVKTFQVQAETFREQQKISLLESKKFLLSIRPEFSITVSRILPDPINHEQRPLDYSNVTLAIELNEQIATNFFLRNKSDWAVDAFQDVSFLYLKKGSRIPLINGIILKRYANVFMDIEVHYSDETGTSYFQKITGYYHKPQISPPLLNSV